MSDISSFIKKLQSEDHNKRYEACEELRVSQPPLPQEALDALAIAKNDKNPDVADAAHRALEFHYLIASEAISVEIPIASKSELILEDVILSSITGIYILFLISPYGWFVSAAALSGGNFLGCIIPIGLIGLLVVAWRENKQNNKIFAIIISLLPAVFIYLILKMSGL